MPATCRCCVGKLPLKELLILGDVDTAIVDQVPGCEMCIEGEAGLT